MTDWQAFIRANTRLMAPPLVPEIRLHLAEESLPIWRKTEEQLGAMNVPPPYWAFAWAGGQALARWLLDNPSAVAGRTVLDLGSGSGLTAIASRMAGAATVLAADIDPLCGAAIALNAEANGVSVAFTDADLLVNGDSHHFLGSAAHSSENGGCPHLQYDVILVGDLFYERDLASRVLHVIEAAAARDADVLIGDPQRSYFPRDRFDRLADFSVPVTRELEDSEIKHTAVWRLRGG